jgi:hypothetical protein
MGSCCSSKLTNLNKGDNVNKLLTVISMMALVGFTQTAVAKNKTLPETREVRVESEYKPHVGLSYGVMMPEGSYSNDDVFGLDIGFQPLIPFGLGLEYTMTNVDADGGGSFDRNDLLVKGSYNFGGDMAVIKHSFAGLGLGASFNDGGTDWVMAPLVGFDIPLSDSLEHVSLGAAAKYSIYEGSQPDSLSLSAALKYWF